MRSFPERIPVARPFARLATLAFGALVLASTGCASRAPRELAFAPSELREAIIERTGVDPPDFEVPFRVSDADVAIARRAVAGHMSIEGRARALANAIRGEEGFGIEYEPTKARTAREAIDDKRGDCLGTSSVFIGLARALGMRAYYLDASDRVNELQNGEQLIISSGHVSAVVRTQVGYQIIDFDNQLKYFARQRIMDDIQALAHYYNNRGYEILEADLSIGAPPKWAEAREQFFIATRLNASLARAWNNLGIADARLGDEESAEINYRVAISQDAQFSEPYNNLGTLYLRRGDLRKARKALAKAIELAPENPYHHFHYSLALARSGKMDGAIAAAEQAVSLDPEITRHRRWLDRLYRGAVVAGAEDPESEPDVAGAAGTSAPGR